MALIKCKECGAQVSNKAKACPSCGAKVPKSVGVIGWLFVIFIVLPIAWQFGTGIGSSGDAAQSRSNSPQRATTSPTKSPWERHEYKDPMSDEVTRMLTLQSKTSTLFDFPYRVAGGSYLNLTFRKKDKDLDAFLKITKGQMQCGYRDCGFVLRVGEGKAQKWTGVRSSTNDSDLMFVRDAKQLEAIVKSGKPFRIAIEFFQAGERVFEFDPAGYPGL